LVKALIVLASAVPSFLFVILVGNLLCASSLAATEVVAVVVTFAVWKKSGKKETDRGELTVSKPTKSIISRE